MNKIAKQIVLIAQQLQQLQNEAKQVNANVRTANWFSNLLARGMTEESKKTIEDVVATLTTNNCVAPMICILKQDLKTIEKVMQPLKKTKETNKYYDMFMQWFKYCIKNLPKAVVEKAKNMNNRDLQNDLENNQFLAKIRDQFGEQINKIKKAVEHAEIKAGLNDTESVSWQDAWNGWGGFEKAE